MVVPVPSTDGYTTMQYRFGVVAAGNLASTPIASMASFRVMKSPVPSLATTMVRVLPLERPVITRPYAGSTSHRFPIRHHPSIATVVPFHPSNCEVVVLNHDLPASGAPPPIIVVFR